MGIGTLYNLLLVNPTINFLLLFLFIFSTWNIPGAFGWSIIALTIFIRLLLNPLFAKQMKTARDIEMLRPKLAALNDKHKNDKQRLQKEQIKLYQDHGINPAGGCLTALIQMPVFIALYHVLQLFLTHDVAKIVQEVNAVAYFDLIKITNIDPWFLGFNLAATPSQFKELGWFYLAVPVVTAILQYYQISMQSPASAPAKNKKSKEADSNKDKKDDAEDMQAAMAKQMRIMFPIMIGYFSYVFPIGLALYWNIFSAFSIITSRTHKTWTTQK
ncbi:MAG: Membrane protein insertase YidC [Microgenomates bacterium OLB23]|nr:MAG: Membrane protein insertase YidC [Microgenomates bacterium OLB23]